VELEDLAREAAEVILLVLTEVGLGGGAAGGRTAAAAVSSGGTPAPAGGRWRRDVRLGKQSRPECVQLVVVGG